MITTIKAVVHKVWKSFKIAELLDGIDEDFFL